MAQIMNYETTDRFQAKAFFAKIKEYFAPRLNENGKFYDRREISHSFEELSCEYSGGFQDYEWQVIIEYVPVMEAIVGTYQVYTAKPVVKIFAMDDLNEAIQMFEEIVNK